MNAKQEALKAYANIGAESSVESANPHKLIQIMLNTAIDKISMAKGHMQRKEIPEKGEQIGRAISLVEGLKASLDEQGGDITNNLDSLYEYVGRRLLEANLTDNAEYLDESSALLSEIKDAWDALPAILTEQT